MIRSAFIWTVCILVMAGFAIWQLTTERTELDADFLSLIGQEQDQQQDETSDIDAVRTLLADSGKQAIIMLSHPDYDHLSDIARQLADTIGRLDGTASVMLPGDNADRLDDLRALYGPYANGLLSDGDRDVLKNGGGEALYQRTLQTLYSPASAFTSATLKQDPFLLMPEFLSALAAKLGVRNDIVTINDRSYLPMIVTLDANKHSDTVAKIWVDGVNNALEEVLKSDPALQTAKTGQIFFAVNEAANAKNDVQTIAVVAALSIAIMICLTFFSPFPLIGAVIVVGSGLIVGAAALTVFFDTIHAIALVFGATMIGISIDYALHYLVIPANGTPTSSRFGKIRKGLGLGLLTSIIGFSALALSPTNLLVQIAVYSIAGLIAAYCSVKFLLPLIPVRPIRENSPIRVAHHWLMRLMMVLLLPRKIQLFVAILLIVALPISAFLIPGHDDVRTLGQSDAELLSDARMISETLGLGGSPVFIRIDGKTAQQRLETSESVRKATMPLISAGKIGSVVALSDFVPSIALQKDNRRLVGDELYQPFSASLSDVLQTPLQIPDLDALYLIPDQAINSLPEIAHFQITTSDIMRLRDVSDVDALNAALVSFENARLISPTAIISNQFAEYRYWTYIALGVVLAIALILAILRYGLDRGVRVFSAPAGAILFALIGGYILGVPISFFTTMAMFLVFAIGADYVLFLSEGNDTEHREHTRLAVFLSLISSVLAFGLLVTSSVPLVSDIGTIIAIGLVGAWFLAFWMTETTTITTDTGNTN
ncbi:MMPL family transporter [Thalassospira lucentensis]|uniref:MMPL family transporter n=1 Tax=Thalassospira lucentensis TaxID=168935 RepID=UPI003D2F4C3E